MANILKLQDQLKGLPDQTLFQYAQNPTGQVPQYLVIAELQRRKNMREEFQQAQPPEQTVAEELVQQGVPQQGIGALPPMQEPEEPMDQGVASLPAPDAMFGAQSMAGGGIVAFEDGGMVQRYQSQGLVSSMPGYDEALIALMQRRETLARELAAMERSGQAQVEEDRAKLSNIGTAAFSALTWPQRQLMSNVQSIREGLGRLGNVVAGKPKYASTGELPRAEFAATPTSKVGALKQQIADLDAAIIQTETQGGKNIFGYEPPPEDKAPPSGLPTGVSVPRAPTLPEAPEFTPKTIDSSAAEKALQEAQERYSEEAIREGRAARREGAGIKDIFDEQRKELEAEREKLKGGKEENAWMAALEAGLAIAGGSSPYALQNIGTGALRGASSYKEAQKELRQNERELRRELNSINREQQNVLEARLANDDAAVERGTDRILRAGDKVDQIALTNAQIENSAMQFNTGKQFDAQLAQFQAQVGDRRLAVQLSADAVKNNNMMRMYQNRIEASDRNTAVRLQQNRVNALAAMNKDPDYADFLASLDDKYKKKGGASNPMYQFEKQTFVNQYLSMALGVTMDGTQGGARSADSLLED